jgi:hypothetical protein
MLFERKETIGGVLGGVLEVIFGKLAANVKTRDNERLLKNEFGRFYVTVGAAFLERGYRARTHLWHLKTWVGLLESRVNSFTEALPLEQAFHIFQVSAIRTFHNFGYELIALGAL